MRLSITEFLHPRPAAFFKLISSFSSAKSPSSFAFKHQTVGIFLYASAIKGLEIVGKIHFFCCDNTAFFKLISSFSLKDFVGSSIFHNICQQTTIRQPLQCNPLCLSQEKYLRSPLLSMFIPMHFFNQYIFTKRHKESFFLACREAISCFISYTSTWCRRSIDQLLTYILLALLFYFS